MIFLSLPFLASFPALCIPSIPMGQEIRLIRIGRITNYIKRNVNDTQLMHKVYTLRCIIRDIHWECICFKQDTYLGCASILTEYAFDRNCVEKWCVFGLCTEWIRI